MSHSAPIVKNKDCHRLVDFLYTATDTEDEFMGISDHWQIIALTMEKEYGGGVGLHKNLGVLMSVEKSNTF